MENPGPLPQTATVAKAVTRAQHFTANPTEIRTVHTSCREEEQCPEKIKKIITKHDYFLPEWVTHKLTWS